jgi:hypothetical protein
MYPKLRTILVYPREYLAPHSSRGPDGTVSEGMQGRVLVVREYRSLLGGCLARLGQL